MTGKLIAQRIEPRRSARLIQQKDGSAVYWVFLFGRQCKQTVLAVEQGKIEEAIKNFDLEPANRFRVRSKRLPNAQTHKVI